MIKAIILLWSFVVLASCSSFKAERLNDEESDKKALKITDEWLAEDTTKSVGGLIKKINHHKGFKRYLKKLGRRPKLILVEIQNETSNAYFPIQDFNDELLDRFSDTDEFVLIDSAARAQLLKELKYQHNGAVDPRQVKRFGKQYGADLMLFGAIIMKQKSRKGKTIKQYSVNIRMTDLETGVEVMRARVKTSKYSKKSSFGW